MNKSIGSGTKSDRGDRQDRRDVINVRGEHGKVDSAEVAIIEGDHE